MSETDKEKKKSLDIIHKRLASSRVTFETED